MFGMLPFRRETRNAIMSPLRMMEDEFRNVFDRFINEMPAVVMERADMPRTWGLDLEETDREAVVRAELPGFELSELSVEVRDNVLTIEARHFEAAKEGEKKEEHERRERFERHVRRSITLPTGLDLERVEATYRNGVLEVRVPRKAEAQGRRVEVRS